MKSIGESLGYDGPSRQVPCRTGCGAWCFLNVAGAGAQETFNKQLTRQGQPFLRDDELIFCRKCGGIWKKEQTEIMLVRQAAEHELAKTQRAAEKSLKAAHNRTGREKTYGYE